MTIPGVKRDSLLKKLAYLFALQLRSESFITRDMKHEKVLQIILELNTH